MNFTDFVYPTQPELQASLSALFPDQSINKPGEYLLVKGEAPVMLVAHMDTVHRDPVEIVCVSEDGDTVMSPQGIGGDDRCGVYGIVETYLRSEYKPWLLFTCDEECGGVGADKFVADYGKGRLYPELDTLKWLIELDRKGSNDAVFYDCNNPAFTAYVLEKGFTEQFGSFSDISTIAPVLGVAAVNLSSGYYNPHCSNEYVQLDELEWTIGQVVEMVRDSCNVNAPVYEYMESEGPNLRLLEFGRDYGVDAYDDYVARRWRNKPEITSVTTFDSALRAPGFLLDSDDRPVPLEIRPEYDDLLVYYDKLVLDELRKENGDESILDLYWYEFESWRDEDVVMERD